VTTGSPGRSTVTVGSSRGTVTGGSPGSETLTPAEVSVALGVGVGEPLCSVPPGVPPTVIPIVALPEGEDAVLVGITAGDDGAPAVALVAAALPPLAPGVPLLPFEGSDTPGPSDAAVGALRIAGVVGRASTGTTGGRPLAPNGGADDHG
jgi:hypothetical protein